MPTLWDKEFKEWKADEKPGMPNPTMLDKLGVAEILPRAEEMSKCSTVAVAEKGAQNGFMFVV
jgi:hypothetical protein